MSSITAAWTENQAVATLDGATITQGASATGDIDLAGLGFIGVKVQIKITYGAAVDDNTTIEVFGSADSGTTDDTVPIWSQSVTYNAGGVATVSFTILNEPYIAIKVTNTTGADGDEDIDLVSKYAGLKYDNT